MNKSLYCRTTFVAATIATVAALAACAPVPLREALESDGLKPLIVYTAKDGSIIHGPGHLAATCASNENGMIRLSVCDGAVARK